MSHELGPEPSFPGEGLEQYRRKYPALLLGSVVCADGQVVTLERLRDQKTGKVRDVLELNDKMGGIEIPVFVARDLGQGSLELGVPELMSRIAVLSDHRPRTGIHPLYAEVILPMYRGQEGLDARYAEVEAYPYGPEAAYDALRQLDQ